LTALIEATQERPQEWPSAISGGLHRTFFQYRTWLARLDDSPSATVFVLLLWQAAALLLHVLAVYLARGDAPNSALVVSACAVGLTFASALWILTRPHLARTVRNAAVVCLGVTTALQWRLRDPLLPIQFDEQQHMRTLRDIVFSHGLFHANPLLSVSPRYPGLEAVAALLHQLGLPLLVAVTAVVLIARLVMVLVLCDAVEQLTGSSRAGGLAVAAYACSAHFVPWDSMFAYQTMALPLAVAAVAFVARARCADDPRLLLIGASVCLLAVAMTHHVTSAFTAIFLVVWTVVERGRPRRRILYGAIVAVIVTVGWAMIQWSLLWVYFYPWYVDLMRQINGAGLRKPFSNAAVYPTPLWEQAFIVYYALAICAMVLALTLVCARARSIRQRLRWDATPNTGIWPRPFLVLMVVPIPVLLVARTLPGFIEIGDRCNTFLYLPLCLLVADAVVRWSRSHSRPYVMRLRTPALLMATGVFVGGFLLGSAPDWARLPGSYLPSAEGRSMDAETLAAVHWAREGLPTGSRIAADRMGSVLLSSEGMWPVFWDGDLSIASLYFADSWGPGQTETAQGLSVRYLYVDSRLAEGLPLVGVYFFVAETQTPQRLTLDQLTKFDGVPGIQLRYRHGPISIYDLSGLNVKKVRSGGWFTKSGPMDNVLIQLSLGLLVGLVLTAAVRFGVGAFVVEKVQAFHKAAGLPLTLAAGLSAVLVTSVIMLSAHIWLGPWAFLSVTLTLLAANRRWAKERVSWAKERVKSGPHTPVAVNSWQQGWVVPAETSGKRVQRNWIVGAVLVALPIAAAIALATGDAHVGDVTRVREILDDPAATHLPVRTDPSSSAIGIGRGR
jgi:hypothetical protein